MGFAEDEVKKYILRNIPKFQDRKASNQLLPHLSRASSLLQTGQEITRKPDREEIFHLAHLILYRTVLQDRCQSGPTRDQLPVYDLTLPPSASFQDQVDTRSQIPESKRPSGNDMTATEGKALEKISVPDQHDRNASESDGSLPGQQENPSNVHLASSRSPVQPRVHLRDASEDQMQTATPESSRSEPGNLVPNWDGFQPSPVCVKNGYFGNMSRTVDKGIAPAPATSSGLTPSRNQPEEDSYLSSGCSPLAPRGQDTEQGEEQDFFGSPANNRSLRLHIQVDEEQKRAQGQQDSNSDVNTLPLLPKEGGRHSQRVNSRTVDGSEIPSGAVPKGSSSFANLQREPKTLPPSIPNETTTASSFKQDSLPVCSGKEPHDHNRCCEATSGVDQRSEGCMAASGGNTDDLETRETPQTAPLLGRSPSDGSPFSPGSSIKERAGQVPNTASVGRFAPLPPDFAGFSSTGVIPPSSPAAVSAIPSDEYSDYLKPPVQETEVVETSLRTASVHMTGGSSRRADTLPSSVMDSTKSRENRKNAGGSSRGAHIYHTNQEEESTSLFKPGVLISGERTRLSSDQQPSSLGGEYSGRSDRLRLSDEYSGNSDSLMISRSEQFGRSVSVGANRASAPLQNGDRSDEGSIQTHTVHIQEPPPVLLTGAPEVTHPGLGNASRSPDDFLDTVAGDQPMKDASSHPGHNDGGRKSLQNESINGSAWLPMSESTWLAVGVALAVLTAVAVVGYKRLQK
uniref:Uncharacterized protein n=1 Tax=Sphaerodactylus townsendi TaxID=933632 RepID=A0ACB8E8R9_9SAUR